MVSQIQVFSQVWWMTTPSENSLWFSWWIYMAEELQSLPEEMSQLMSVQKKEGILNIRGKEELIQWKHKQYRQETTWQDIWTPVTVPAIAFLLSVVYWYK